MKEKKDFTFRNCSFEIKRNQFFESVILKKPFFFGKKNSPAPGRKEREKIIFRKENSF